MFYMIFYRKIEKKSKFYFVPGIILDHFGYPKSIFDIQKSKFYEILQKKFWIKKSIFIYKNRFLDLKKPEKTWKKTGKIAKSAEKPGDS